jgi:hypothetical protein
MRNSTTQPATVSYYRESRGGGRTACCNLSADIKEEKQAEENNSSIRHRFLQVLICAFLRTRRALAQTLPEGSGDNADIDHRDPERHTIEIIPVRSATGDLSSNQRGYESANTIYRMQHSQPPMRIVDPAYKRVRLRILIRNT